MKHSFFLFPLLCVFVSGCAFPRSGSSQNESVRAKNRARFYQLLNSGHIPEATAFIPYFSEPNEEEKWLLAQYYLLTCQPRKAEHTIQQFTNLEERSLFLAVLYSMVATPRPEEKKMIKLSSNERSIPPRGRNVVPQVKQTIHDSEIWQDEWPDIRPDGELCTAMPTANSKQARAKFRAQALELFSSLPHHMFTRDFNIVALAMDVDARLPDMIGLIRYFRSQAGNPYYRRLRLMTMTAKSEDAINVSALRKNEIELTPLRLTNIVQTPAIVRTPFLLREEDFIP